MLETVRAVFRDQGCAAEAAAVVATAAQHTLAIRARIGDGRGELARVAEAAVRAICGVG